MPTPTAARGKRLDRRRDPAASRRGLHGQNLDEGRCPAQPGDAEEARDRPQLQVEGVHRPSRVDPHHLHTARTRGGKARGGYGNVTLRYVTLRYARPWHLT